MTTTATMRRPCWSVTRTTVSEQGLLHVSRARGAGTSLGSGPSFGRGAAVQRGSTYGSVTVRVGSRRVSPRIAVGTCSSNREYVARTASSSSGSRPGPLSSSPTSAVVTIAITSRLNSHRSFASGATSALARALPIAAVHFSPPVAASSKAACAVPSACSSRTAVLVPNPWTPGRLSEVSPRRAARSRYWSGRTPVTIASRSGSSSGEASTPPLRMRSIRVCSSMSE